MARIEVPPPGPQAPLLEALDLALGPVVGVAPRAEFKGLHNFDSLAEEQKDGLEDLMVVTPTKAFEHDWPFDAHFVTYYVQGANGEAEENYPRVNKKGPALRQIRQHGGDVKAWCLTFEIDSKDIVGSKVEISPEILGTFWDLVLAAGGLLSWVLDFTYYYSTKRGCRLIYVLKQPMSVDRSEKLHKFLSKQLAQGLGIAIDSVSDWTRLFRLPRALRTDGGAPERLGPNGAYYFEEVCQADKRFDAAALLGTAAMATPIVEPEVIDGPRPEADQIPLLIGRDGARPEWWADVEKALRPKLCYTSVYKYRELAGSGHRMDTVQQSAGEVCKALAYVDRGDKYLLGPAHAYALLYASVEQLEPDDSTPDWLGELWGSCQRYWARDLAERQQKLVDRETAIISTRSLQDNIIAGMREWCNDPDLRADDFTAARYASSKLIVGTPQGYYHIMRPNGYYDSAPVKTPLLYARIRELGMESVIQTTYEDEKGNRKKVRREDLIDRHTTVIREIEGHGGGPGNYIVGMGGEYPKLILRLYARRSDLKAKFDPDVNSWLRMVHGPSESQIALGNAAIGHALDFEGGAMAALAWIGSRSIGKKMFVEGLAEALDTGIMASSADMGKYSENLLKSPFLVLNEGLPMANRFAGGMDPADQFRLLTAGDRINSEAKFKDKVTIKAALRMLIFANNQNILTMIAGQNRNLTQDDKAALAQRLIVFQVNARAQGWLRAQGGMKWTQGWIAGDSGGVQSEYRIARHFLWLYENRPAVAFGNRFLIEGNLQDTVVNNLSTRSGHAPQIVEFLVAMIEAAVKGRAVKGMHYDEEQGNIWVTGHAVALWQREQGERNANRHIPEREVIQVYRGLSRVNDADSGLVHTFDTKCGPKTATWWRLDLSPLLQESYDLGYDNQGLEKLATGHDSNKILRLGGA